MAHKITYTVDAEPGEEQTTLEADEIFESYVATDKITDHSSTEQEDGTYLVELVFIDSATADQFFAEMAAIGEHESTGHTRSNFLREDT